jgi:hypothetical protein
MGSMALPLRVSEGAIGILLLAPVANPFEDE